MTCPAAEGNAGETTKLFRADGQIRADDTAATGSDRNARGFESRYFFRARSMPSGTSGERLGPRAVLGCRYCLVRVHVRYLTDEVRHAGGCGDVISADENGLLVRPGLGERAFLGGAVAWVATVVGMSVVPLLHTLFGTY